MKICVVYRRENVRMRLKAVGRKSHNLGRKSGLCKSKSKCDAYLKRVICAKEVENFGMQLDTAWLEWRKRLALLLSDLSDR